MTRPLYETADDRLNEELAIERVMRALKCDDYHTMPRRYPIDFALTKRGAIQYWAEVKCRANPANQYQDYMISLAKVQGLLDMQASTHIPAVLVVGWTDCVGILRLPTADMKFRIGGRKDRGDDQDIEPTAHIETDRFHRISW